MRAAAITKTLTRSRAKPIRLEPPLFLIRRWLAVYRTRQTEQRAIAQLNAMSDRLLRDIGLTRSEIASAVRYKAGPGGAARGRQ